MSIRKLALADALPGMILARPVIGRDRAVLVQQDVTLTERLLQLLQSRRVTHLSVHEDPAAGPCARGDRARNAILQRERRRFGDAAGDTVRQALLEAVVAVKSAAPGSPVATHGLDHCPDGQAPSRERVLALVKSTRALPTLPAIYHRVEAATQDPASSAGDVAAVVSSDPAFASSLLRMANSALYAVSEPITTVTRAVSMLGHQEIRDLCLMASVLDLLRLTAGQTSLAESHWRHALGTAAAARWLGQKRDIARSEELFLAGLLHDLGKLIWLQHFPKDLETVHAAAEIGGQTFLDCERTLLGMSHPRVGRMIAQHWRLPKLYAEVIAFHHAPDQASHWHMMCHAVHLADIVSQALELGGPSLVRVPRIEQLSWQEFRFGPEDWLEILEGVQGQFADIEKSLALDPDRSQSDAQPAKPAVFETAR